jgi:putative Mg2+ transporter-C (MgtC) family protein
MAALSFPEFPMSNDFSDLDILMKLVVAALLSGVLGWEREVFGKQAGLRTHILVGVSAAMFVGLGGALMEYFGRDDEDMQYDPIRVIEATVAAISFLGAGTIFVSRDRGETVKGLTTAAALWATAGVGLAVGLGRFVLASGATALIFVVLHLLGRLERRGLPGAAKAARDEKSSEDGEP